MTPNKQWKIFHDKINVYEYATFDHLNNDSYAGGIHGYDFENVKKTYDNISLKMYTQATPTLFNASTNHPQLSSCFLIDID